jgi:hypothetical protein
MFAVVVNVVTYKLARPAVEGTTQMVYRDAKPRRSGLYSRCSRGASLGRAPGCSRTAGAFCIVCFHFTM